MDSRLTAYPSNIQNEQLVLGHLFRDNHLFWKVNSFLKDSHFFEPVHQRIYAAFSEAIEKGAVTPVTLKAQFDEDIQLKPIGGAEYLAKVACMAIMPVYDMEGSANLILDLARRRDLIDLGIKTTAEAQDMQSQQDVSSLASSVLSAASAIISDTKATSFKDGYGVVSDIMDGLGEVVESYSSGIRQLDQSMDGGFYPSCVYAFAGKPKTGKTILACTLAANLALNGVKIGFVSLEMKSESVMSRILCRLAGIYPSALRGKGRNIDQLKQKIIGVQNMTKLRNLVMCYEPSIEFEALKHRLHYLVHNCKVKGFILDYWQIVEGCPKGQNDANHLSTVAQWISAFCKKENVFAIILLQQNEDGTLYKSRGINRATEQLYYIHRIGENDDSAWLEMEFSRYSENLHVGSEDSAAFLVDPHGPYFKEI